MCAILRVADTLIPAASRHSRRTAAALPAARHAAPLPSHCEAKSAIASRDAGERVPSYAAFAAPKSPSRSVSRGGDSTSTMASSYRLHEWRHSASATAKYTLRSVAPARCIAAIASLPCSERSMLPPLAASMAVWLAPPGAHAELSSEASWSPVASLHLLSPCTSISAPTHMSSPPELAA